MKLIKQVIYNETVLYVACCNLVLHRSTIYLIIARLELATRKLDGCALTIQFLTPR